MGSGARIIDVDEAAVEACIVALPPLMMLLVASLGFSLSLCDSEKKKRWSFSPCIEYVSWRSDCGDSVLGF